MIKTVKMDSVFEMGEGTDQHRLVVEWHETVGIGVPKDELATCPASAKELWPELYALKGAAGMVDFTRSHHLWCTAGKTGMDLF